MTAGAGQTNPSFPRKCRRAAGLALATGFFLTYPMAAWTQKRGRRLSGAGLIGTAAGLLCVRFLPMDPIRCLLTLLGALLVSVAIADFAEEELGGKDDSRIVIDEWVGYLFAMALLPKTWPVLAAAFVLFRVVDTLKPLGVNRMASFPGGWGVVLDDVAAGLVVNIFLHIAVILLPR